MLDKRSVSSIFFHSSSEINTAFCLCYLHLKNNRLVVYILVVHRTRLELARINHTPLKRARLPNSATGASKKV